MEKLLRIFILTGILLSVISEGYAQDRTFGRNRSVSVDESATVLIVPYEPKMYISDVTKELCEFNEMSVDEIRRVLREGLCQLVATELSAHGTVIDLLNEGDEGKEKDIYEIYGAINYDYIQVPIPDSLKTNRRRPDQQGRGAYLEGGEIKSYYDGKERYMDTRVDDQRIFDYLKKKYSPDYVLFINELDIRVKRSGPPMPGEMKPRQIKVHYTIYSGKGKKIKGSAVMQDYPYGEKNVFDLIRKYFRPIAGVLELEIFPNAEEEAPSFVLPGRGY